MNNETEKQSFFGQAIIKNRLFGVLVTAITFLIAFYYGSFASKAQVKGVENRVSILESSIKTKATSEDNEAVIKRLDNLLVGLCHAYPKTCYLKDIK